MSAIESLMYCLIVLIFAMLCSVSILVYLDLLKMILRNLFCIFWAFDMCVLCAAAQTWCPYKMTGLTHVLYRVNLMLVLSLLFVAISGYSLLRSGCARIDLACMAGAQETLESRTTPRYFALCAQGMGCPDMLI